MQEQFIPYKQALELKKLGFDDPCIMCFYGISRYDKIDSLYLHSGMGRVCNSDLNEKEHGITAPLWQQAFDWFREQYKLDSFVKSNYNQTIKTGYYFNADEFYSETFKNYEEARLFCLDKLIEIVKTKKL